MVKVLILFFYIHANSQRHDERMPTLYIHESQKQQSFIKGVLFVQKSQTSYV